MKWAALLLWLWSVPAVFAEQGACFGRMEYTHLSEGIELYEGIAVWDLPPEVKEPKDLGTSFVVTFPSEIASHEYMWADVYFGKKRNKPVFQASLDVDGDEILTAKFATALDSAVFYVRVVYMRECSEVVLEQRFES